MVKPACKSHLKAIFHGTTCCYVGVVMWRRARGVISVEPCFARWQVAQDETTHSRYSVAFTELLYCLRIQRTTVQLLSGENSREYSCLIRKANMDRRPQNKYIYRSPYRFVAVSCLIRLSVLKIIAYIYGEDHRISLLDIHSTYP